MGDCQCSNIAIMQLFHELKQQFPALPDHVVSQCIAENSHDKNTCAASLRETQKLNRSFFGSLPATSGITATTIPDAGVTPNINIPSAPRNQRPISLDIGPLSSLPPQQCHYSTHKRRFLPPLPPLLPPQLDASSTRRFQAAPSSAPPDSTYSMHNFFQNTSGTRSVTSSSPVSSERKPFIDSKSNLNTPTTPPTAAGFELNVNVACSPASSDNPSLGEKLPGSSNIIGETGYSPTDLHTRSYTSVSLTLRPPSSEPQPPINIRSQGSSLTYSSSSSDPRGFQSRLQISIGSTSGNLGSVSAVRRPATMNHLKQNNNLISMSTIPNNNIQRTSDCASTSGTPLLHENTAINSPQFPLTASTPGFDPNGFNRNDPSSSTTNKPSISQPLFSMCLNTPSMNKEPIVSSPNNPPIMDLSLLALNQVSEQQRHLVTEQFIRKEKLAKELQMEKGKLAAMKKELETLTRPRDPLLSYQELDKRLRSEIYQLRLECNILADEVDQRSDPTVPFGETNEEFYQGIYTGQAVNLPAFTSPSLLHRPPPLPSVPPALGPTDGNGTRLIDNDNNRDGPSWICEMCTFKNHPLMDTCEQCDMPRFPSLEPQGETQDIHIRVTHHHNFSPRRVVHSWVM